MIILDDILPCPFCGGTELEFTVGTTDREGIPTAVSCAGCGANGPWEYEHDGCQCHAVTAWNKRDTIKQDK